jgi:hypothetical protein
MSKTYTTECLGFIVTVWMISLELWTYRISKGAKLYPPGMVNADNRIDAAAAALAEVLNELETPHA